MVQILPADQVETVKIKKLTDAEIGKDYYSLEELDSKIEQSRIKDMMASFVLVDQGLVKGLRLSFPAGHWQKGKGEELSPQKWPHSLQDTAYFQSLFISEDYRNQGWGTKLSMHSIGVLKQLGAKGIVCHSWLESPGGSSGKYLRTLGFVSICQYPMYWQNVDYICPRCGQPCSCTAEEMYLNLEGES